MAKKPVLLFIHGFRGNHLGLQETAKYFRQAGYKTYAPDIPPAANTQDEIQGPIKKFTDEDYATWVANYIVEKKLDHPILIGHSMGSIIVAATAERFPNLIADKVVFLSPIAVKPPRAITSLSPLSVIVPNKIVGYATTKYLIVPKDKKKFRETLDTTYKCSEKFTKRTDVARAAKFSSTYAISDFNFTQKCIFIAGEKDRLNSVEAVQKTAKKFNADAVFIKNAGHLVNYEEPIKLAKEIEKFIA